MESLNLYPLAKEISLVIGKSMRELGQLIHATKMCHGVPWIDAKFILEKIDRWERESQILETIDDDLHDVDLLPEMWAEREHVERLANGVK